MVVEALPWTRAPAGVIEAGPEGEGPGPGAEAGAEKAVDSAVEPGQGGT